MFSIKMPSVKKHKTVLVNVCGIINNKSYKKKHWKSALGKKTDYIEKNLLDPNTYFFE